jgi:hypothetical protein
VQEKASQVFKPFLGGHHVAVARKPSWQLDLGEYPLFARPGDEPSRVLACRGATCEPGVDVLLRRGVQVAVPGGEPGQELSSDCCRLLGVEERARADWSGIALTTETVKQAPASEALDDLAVLWVVDLGELVGEPAFETRQVGISRW